MSEFQRKLSQVLYVAQQIPGAIDVLGANAKKLRDLRRSFEDTHWDDDQEIEAREVRVPTHRAGVVEMGELVSVVYLATKGGGTFEWEHPFEGGEGNRPILSYAKDGSGLIVVRGNSRYRVTKRGIEG
jgi:hypothetical protein